ncbi:hypothetical protein Adt_32163 [Abeliophyllum distichum]|uniref:Uncharacterized protein n=1 Tax=Abeliophyllum distichum TaxID=126358 RepID=A0ABD1RG65_9LAMI
MHCTTINNATAQFLYHLAHKRKKDLGSYINSLISTVDFQTVKRHTAIFPALISSICEKVRFQIFTAELVVKFKRPINHLTLENARRHTEQAMRVAPTTEEQPQEGQPAVP